MYISPKRDDTSKDEPLISKNYEVTSNDNNRLKKPIDWESKLILLKEIQPSSENDAAEKKNFTTPPKEMDKREKRALDAIFRTFNESKAKKPQTEFVVVLTSKYKFQTVIAFFFGFFFLFWI